MADLYYRVVNGTRLAGHPPQNLTTQYLKHNVNPANLSIIKNKADTHSKKLLRY